ncbi:MAG: hypothetical protein QUS11_03315 [Candidatus Fermentibacter sp.]|nr:hypothetical protein [Candidatus Fermentibacter sp.]
MGWLSDKMQRWRESIDRRAGTGSGDRVTAGWEGLSEDLAANAEWSAGAQGRLVTEVPDGAARRGIMQERSCRFVEEFGDSDILALRGILAETGSPEAVVAAMRDNPDRFGDPFIESDAIIEIRRPRDPGAFALAQTSLERRMAACFCPLARGAQGRMPVEYCECSAGWYRGIYEGIFGVPVDVTVEESLLNGDARCRFSIRIPGVLDSLES